MSLSLHSSPFAPIVAPLRRRLFGIRSLGHLDGQEDEKQEVRALWGFESLSFK
ncbi:hypothetical protein AMTR_s00135p00089220 [Amborella trichopoda]|uniref:Uncharacterized protein n=1 Tax=Amborella trichopoda TaxID=13333 RepID=W1P5H1_AMBTC|nr:hypothetical protein AMTR_s00135p00089220 [Amborella trichopoda]